MSDQNDRYWGGFLSGAIFGGITGGLLGTWLASKWVDRLSSEGTTLDETHADETSASLPYRKP